MTAKRVFLASKGTAIQIAPRLMELVVYTVWVFNYSSHWTWHCQDDQQKGIFGLRNDFLPRLMVVGCIGLGHGFLRLCPTIFLCFATHHQLCFVTCPFLASIRSISFPVLHCVGFASMSPPTHTPPHTRTVSC